METIQTLFSYLMHIDVYLINFVSDYGVWAYCLLFLIIFCETGLVVTPFLPGDSLLFAAGSLAATSDNLLNINMLFVILLLAAALGNKLNYVIGRTLGDHIHWLVNKNHLAKSHAFYEKHGGKTIILARFIPVIRTFAPFIAGISKMNLRLFTVYNLLSALLWVGTLVFAGYLFGGIPLIKNNFSIVIYTIIALSLLPPALTFAFHRKN